MRSALFESASRLSQTSAEPALSVRELGHWGGRWRIGANVPLPGEEVCAVDLGVSVACNVHSANAEVPLWTAPAETGLLSLGRQYQAEGSVSRCW